MLRWSAFGLTLLESDREELLAGLVPRVRLLRLAVLPLALLLGSLAARRLRVGPVTGLGLGAALFFALDPGLLGFVAERSAIGAETRLDVTHALRGLGVGLVAWAAALAFREPRGVEREAGRAPGRTRWVVAGLLLAVGTELASRALLGGSPLTNDGRAYLFQAELFASGSMTHPASALDGFFSARQVYFGERVFSKYPPGHSLLLTPGVWLGWPRFVPTLLLALLPGFAFALVRRLGCPRPQLATWLFCASPMVWGVEVLFLSHGSSLPLAVGGLAAALAAIDAASERRAARAAAMSALTGAALSLCVLARPGTGLVLVLCALSAAVLRLRARAIPLALFAVLAALPALAFLLAHNAATTGSPWDTAYGLYAREVSPNDRWGMVNLPTALPNSLYNLARLDVWLLGLAPGLFLVVLGATRGSALRRRSFALLPPVGLVLFHAFLRFHGVPWCGPLYLVEAGACLCALAAAGAGVLAGKGLPLAPAVLACAAPFGSALVLGAQWSRAADEAAAREAPLRAARAAGVESGVVFVALTREVDVRRFHMTPPVGTSALLVVRDRGAENRLLLDALGGPSAYRFDPVSGSLEELDAPW